MPREGASSFSERSLQVDAFELEVWVAGYRVSHWAQDSPSVGISALQPQDKMAVSVTCCDSHSAMAADKHPRILMALSSKLKGERGWRKMVNRDTQRKSDRGVECGGSFVSDWVCVSIRNCCMNIRRWFNQLSSRWC